MDTDSFIVPVKTEDIYKDIVKDVEGRFDTSNNELQRSFPKVKEAIGLMKDELGGKIMKKFVELMAKTYSYLTDDNNKSKKKQKVQKNV